MSTVKATNIQLGSNGDASRNFVWQTNNDGTAKLARGNVGATTQDIIVVGADGRVSFPQGEIHGESALITLLGQGQFVDFTIPDNVKKIEVLLNQVSVSASGVPIIQLGGSNGIETTGYDACGGATSTTAATAAQTIGFPVSSTGVAVAAYTGIYVLELMDATTNTWIANYNGVRMDAPAGNYGGGEKTITGMLRTLRIDTTAADTFDTGKAKVRWYF